MGTPEFAVPVLAGIVAGGHVVTAVYSRAPQPGGARGLEPVPSPVHVAARRFGAFAANILQTAPIVAQSARGAFEMR